MTRTPLAVCLLLTIMCHSTDAAVIHVPADEPTIQAGLLATTLDDTVLIASGTYTEHDISISGPEHGGVTIASAAGDPDSVIIDAEELGGVFSFGSYVHLSGLTLKNGRATYGGAVGGSFTATDCRFIDNEAVNTGGVAWGNQSMYSIRFDRCEFRGNTAGYSGGVLQYSMSDVTCEGCLFVGNSAPSGGAICDPGGIRRGFTTLTDCTFLENIATEAGGALWLGDYAWISTSGCTFARNEAPEGAIFFGAGYSDIWGMFETSILAFSEGGSFFDSLGGSLETITRTCIVFGNAGGDSLAGHHDDNLFVDPLFCGLGEDDLTLCANSPALAGANPWGVRVGAHPIGCGECAHSPVEPESWGAVKARYR